MFDFLKGFGILPRPDQTQHIQPEYLYGQSGVDPSLLFYHAGFLHDKRILAEKKEFCGRAEDQCKTAFKALSDRDRMHRRSRTGTPGFCSTI